MKVYLLTGLMAIMLCSNVICATNHKMHIKIGIIEKNVPYTSVDEQGDVRGFSIDIFNALKKHISLEPHYVSLSMEEIAEMLQTKELDLTVYMAQSKSNYEKFYLSIPYFSPERDIITREGDRLSKLADLKDKTVIVKRSTVTHESLPSMGICPNKIIAVETIDEGLNLLSQGTGDCLITASDKARHMIHYMGYSGLQVQQSDIGPIDICFASHSRQLISDINRALSKIIASGEYDAIYHNWFHKVEHSNQSRYLLLVILLLVVVVGIISLLTYVFRRRVVRTRKENLYLNKYLTDALDVGEMTVWVYDVDTRTIGSVYGKQMLQKRLPLDEYCRVFHPDDWDDLYRLASDVIHEIAFEQTIISRVMINGEWRSFRITMSLMADRPGMHKQIIGISKDCTDEVAELIRKEEVIRNLDMAIGLGRLLRWRYNIETGVTKIIDEEGTTHYYNDISQIGIDKKDESRFAEYMNQIISQNTDHDNFEMCVYCHLSNRMCHYRLVARLEYVNGVPSTINGVWLNTTEEFNALKELQEYHSKMYLAIEAANLMAWSYDIDKLSFTIIHGESDWGYNKVSFTSDEYMALVHPEDTEKFTNVLYDMVSGGKEKGTVVYRFNSAEGWRWYRSVFMPIRIEGVVVSITGILMDITLEIELAERAHNRMNLIQAEHDYLNTILNSVSVPIHIKDPETGVYNFANAASKEAYGISVGMSIEDILLRNEIPSGKAAEMRLISDGDIYEADENIVLANGAKLETHVIKKSIEYAGSKQILIVRTDETENNKALRASQILSASLPALKAFSWYYDSRTGVMYTHHNMKLERGLDKQMTLDEMIVCIHDEDKGRFVNMFMNLARQVEKQKTFQYRADLEVIGDYEWWECCAAIDRRNDGERQYVVVCGLTININDNKKAELEMLRLKSKSDLILRNTNSGLIFIDQDHRVQWTNSSRVLREFNHGCYRIGEVCYVSCGLDRPCQGCNLHEIIQSQEPKSENCVTFGNRMYDVVKTPVMQDGDIYGVLLRIDDRTEHYVMIDEIRKAKEKAEESDRLKSAFLANISHEIRTPLNAIVGFSDLIANTPDLQERELYGQIILNNNQLLLQLIDDILDLSKIEAGLFQFENELINLNQVFCEAYSTFSLRKPADVVLNCKMPVEGLHVFLDKKRFTQIINNFLSNAVKYTAQGEIEFGYQVRGDRLYVYVKDTGIGISQANRNKVFQRFQKFDDFAQGTGLGLAICKAICDNDPNSTIGFESDEGKGSKFWFEVQCEMQYSRQLI